MRAMHRSSEGAVSRAQVSDDRRADDARSAEVAYADLPERYRPIYDPDLSTRTFLDIRDADAPGMTRRKKGLLAALVNFVFFSR